MLCSSLWTHFLRSGFYFKFRFCWLLMKLLITNGKCTILCYNWIILIAENLRGSREIAVDAGGQGTIWGWEFTGFKGDCSWCRWPGNHLSNGWPDKGQLLRTDLYMKAPENSNIQLRIYFRDETSNSDDYVSGHTRETSAIRRLPTLCWLSTRSWLLETVWDWRWHRYLVIVVLFGIRCNMWINVCFLRRKNT